MDKHIEVKKKMMWLVTLRWKSSKYCHHTQFMVCRHKPSKRFINVLDFDKMNIQQIPNISSKMIERFEQLRDFANNYDDIKYI